MNATSRPRLTAARWKTPDSARHGSHHEAHLLITTGRPRSAARRARRARASPGSSSLAWACSAASGAGEPARRACICATVSPDGAAGMARGALQLNEADGEQREQRRGRRERPSASL